MQNRVVLLAILCIASAHAFSTLYRFSPQAQQHIDRELGTLMLRCYLEPQSSQIKLDGTNQYQDLIITIPRTEWERLTYQSWLNSARTLLVPTIYGSLYGAAIGAMLGGILGLSLLMQTPVFTIGLIGCCGILIIAACIELCKLGTIIGGIIGCIAGLITGITKLLGKKQIERYKDAMGDCATTMVVVHFPALNNTLQHLATSGGTIIYPLTSADLVPSGYTIV